MGHSCFELGLAYALRKWAVIGLANYGPQGVCGKIHAQIFSDPRSDTILGLYQPRDVIEEEI
jgi:hypothetical protein